jgi:hypothetical protein
VHKTPKKEASKWNHECQDFLANDAENCRAKEELRVQMFSPALLFRCAVETCGQ